MENNNKLSVQYVQATNESFVEYIHGESEDDKYNNYVIAKIIVHYIVFSMTPFIIYLTIVYIHPKVSSHLKRQYLQKTDNVNHDTGEQEAAKLKFVKNWKIFCLRCLCSANLLMISCMLLHLTVMLDFPAASDLEVYDQTIDRYVTTLSYFVSMFITAVMFKPLISRCRRLNVISIISMTISLNMVYIVLYFFPTILVTFTYGPLQAKYNCLMNM